MGITVHLHISLHREMASKLLLLVFVIMSLGISLATGAPSVPEEADDKNLVAFEEAEDKSLNTTDESEDRTFLGTAMIVIRNVKRATCFRQCLMQGGSTCTVKWAFFEREWSCARTFPRAYAITNGNFARAYCLKGCAESGFDVDEKCSLGPITSSCSNLFPRTYAFIGGDVGKALCAKQCASAYFAEGTECSFQPVGSLEPITRACKDYFPILTKIATVVEHIG